MGDLNTSHGLMTRQVRELEGGCLCGENPYRFLEGENDVSFMSREDDRGSVQAVVGDGGGEARPDRWLWDLAPSGLVFHLLICEAAIPSVVGTE